MHWWKCKLNLKARTMEKPLGWDLHAQTDCPFGRWSCVGGCEAHWARTLERLGSSSKNAILTCVLRRKVISAINGRARYKRSIPFLSSKRDLSAIFLEVLLDLSDFIWTIAISCSKKIDKKIVVEEGSINIFASFLDAIEVPFIESQSLNKIVFEKSNAVLHTSPVGLNGDPTRSVMWLHRFSLSFHFVCSGLELSLSV